MKAKMIRLEIPLVDVLCIVDELMLHARNIRETKRKQKKRIQLIEGIANKIEKQKNNVFVDEDAPPPALHEFTSKAFGQNWHLEGSKRTKPLGAKVVPKKEYATIVALWRKACKEARNKTKKKGGSIQ